MDLCDCLCALCVFAFTTMLRLGDSPYQRRQVSILRVSESCILHLVSLWTGRMDALHAPIKQQLAGVDQRIALGPWREGLRPFCSVSRI